MTGFLIIFFGFMLLAYLMTRVLKFYRTPNVNKVPAPLQPERSEGDTCKCKPSQRICTPPRKSNINKIKKCGNCGKPLPKKFQP